jgi:hypothetical protein
MKPIQVSVAATATIKDLKIALAADESVAQASDMFRLRLKDVKHCRVGELCTAYTNQPADCVFTMEQVCTGERQKHLRRIRNEVAGVKKTVVRIEESVRAMSTGNSSPPEIADRSLVEQRNWWKTNIQVGQNHVSALTEQIDRKEHEQRLSKKSEAFISQLHTAAGTIAVAKQAAKDAKATKKKADEDAKAVKKQATKDEAVRKKAAKDEERSRKKAAKDEERERKKAAKDEERERKKDELAKKQAAKDETEDKQDDESSEGSSYESSVQPHPDTEAGESSPTESEVESPPESSSTEHGVQPEPDSSPAEDVTRKRKAEFD